jgi:tRNA threonylcarbamoyl adenosine modification protein YjeE
LPLRRIPVIKKGKTQFTKGLAKAMGITENIVSPTFNLELDYGRLVHMDAWRMQNGEELENLGLKQKIGDKSILVIEWADRVADTIRKYNEEAVVVWVRIEYGRKEDERKISWGII